MTQKISIIIPVYKVEPYIEKCIQSLLDQTHTNFEALIVDDGSPDQSIEIAQKIVADDPRFIFLNKPNGGQASARNLGIDHASGTYIAFLDSDDYFNPSFLQESIEHSVKNNLDIVVTGMLFVTESGEKIGSWLPNVNNYYKLQDYLQSHDTLDFSVCNKLWKTELFKSSRFMTGIMSEDREFIPRMLYNKSIGEIPKLLYNYVHRKGSTVRSYNKRYVPSLIQIMEHQRQFLIENNLYVNNNDIFQYAYINQFLLHTAIYLAKFSPCYHEDVQELFKILDKKIANKKIINQVYKTDRKKRLALLIFMKKPFLFKVLISIRKKIMKNI